MYPFSTLPDYLTGTAYIMSMDVVMSLYQVALNESYINIDDLFLTGICAEKAHIKRIDHPLIKRYKTNETCLIKGSISTPDHINNSMIEIYKNVLNMNIECETLQHFVFHK